MTDFTDVLDSLLDKLSQTTSFNTWEQTAFLQVHVSVPFYRKLNSWPPPIKQMQVLDTCIMWYHHNSLAAAANPLPGSPIVNNLYPNGSQNEVHCFIIQLYSFIPNSLTTQFILQS